MVITCFVSPFKQCIQTIQNRKQDLHPSPLTVPSSQSDFRSQKGHYLLAPRPIQVTYIFSLCRHMDWWPPPGTSHRRHCVNTGPPTLQRTQVASVSCSVFWRGEEASCMTALAVYNVFGIQRSLVLMQQLECLPAPVFSSQSLETFMKWWWILKQANPPEKVAKDKSGAIPPPSMGRVLFPKDSNNSRELNRETQCHSQFSFPLYLAKGQPLGQHTDWQRQVTQLSLSQNLVLSWTHIHNCVANQQICVTMIAMILLLM